MSDDAPFMVVGGSRRGRPPIAVGEPSADVHVTLPAGLYDAAYLVASKKRISVPEVIRRALAKALTKSNLET